MNTVITGTVSSFEAAAIGTAATLCTAAACKARYIHAYSVGVTAAVLQL
jgi:hypothetical protein